ncbi:hypothetical protein BEI59_33005 [Eisenbergiella tayi]|uniref:Uncharacterized protein n=1 Tax=Eisenbergiella tayi TaxID=1432052 RepID=A0A1E3U725_9FIRM|nr:hypothetical protein BEI59_33005 [Eisenbergiella tayi]ODR39834.1 hypothetical protein BEI60_06530 [Eisenbergiella tayi]ODR41779.1 hypothetical protein BEI62_06505 [Eisenbergiella tayi]ODR60786.1 hypothetical protein BEI63_03470 [Eisenbergiella tayi]RJW31441.1 hypothetical protein DXC97_31985 [Lachnospiraceae bacterium TF09-5]
MIKPISRNAADEIIILFFLSFVQFREYFGMNCSKWKIAEYSCDTIDTASDRPYNRGNKNSLS